MRECAREGGGGGGEAREATADSIADLAVSQAQVPAALWQQQHNSFLLQAAVISPEKLLALDTTNKSHFLTGTTPHVRTPLDS